MQTTLNKIRDKSPCEYGWKKLLTYLGKTKADDEPLAITTIIDSNGLDDALWCLRAVTGHGREIRLYAVWCARQVQHLMTDQRSLDALDKAERFANGSATQAELNAALVAAEDAARAAWVARDAARVAAGDAARATEDAARAAWVARDAARVAAGDAARDAARVAAGDAARATEDAARAAWVARDAARVAAWAAAGDAQEKQLRKICAECEVAV